MDKMKKYYIGLGVIGVITLVFLGLTVVKGASAKQDNDTKAKASTIAKDLNSYVSKNRKIPESLDEAGIKDVPKTISYKKDSSTEYTFCATYKEAKRYGSVDPTSLISGSTLRQNSTSLDSDIFSTTSTYKASTLYPTSSYKKGENCQTIKPYLSSSSYYNDDIPTTTTTSTAAKARDTQRKADINAIYSKLEEYYNENNGYPDGALSATVLKGIDSEALKDADGRAVSTVGGFLTTTKAPTVYVYNTAEYSYTAYGCKTAGAQKVVGATCTKYILKAYLETDAAGSYTKQSLN